MTNDLPQKMFWFCCQPAEQDYYRFPRNLFGVSVDVVDEIVDFVGFHPSLDWKPCFDNWTIGNNIHGKLTIINTPMLKNILWILHK